MSKMMIISVVVCLLLAVCNGFVAPRSAVPQTARFMFNFGKKAAPAAPPAPVITALALEAIDTFRKDRPKSVAADESLLEAFASMATTMGGSEDAVLKMVKKNAEILLIDPARVQANFDIYTEKWGVEKATGVVSRNPLLFTVSPTGYGGAVVAGDETVVMSYVIDATRPLGKVGILVLFALLSKKAIESVL